MLANPFDTPNDSYTILVNEEGQHSLWPAQVNVPDGWTAVHGPDERSACLDYVRTHWTDIRPLSFAAQVDAS